MKEINGVKIFTLREVAELLGISYQTALKYVKQGRIPAAKAGNNYAITEQSLMRWLNGETPLANVTYTSKVSDNTNGK